MKKINFLLTIALLFISVSKTVIAQENLRVGYSLGINGVTEKAMQYAKSVGVDAIEIAGINSLINPDSVTFKFTNEEIIKKFEKAKQAADRAGIEIWSVHMAFGKNIDISLLDEDKRQKAIAIHKHVLEYCKIIKPKIILFHPSYRLELNVRAQREIQLVKSVKELNIAVKAINSMMVVENMLGPELLMPDKKLERPLLRSVEETVKLFKKFPKDVYSAVDLNHIAHPEKLLLAMGERVKTLHVADGDGLAERHYFPCEQKGENDWSAIFAALRKIKYNGVFMFESKAKDIKAYRICYEQLKSIP